MSLLGTSFKSIAIRFSKWGTALKPTSNAPWCWNIYQQLPKDWHTCSYINVPSPWSICEPNTEYKQNHHQNVVQSHTWGAIRIKWSRAWVVRESDLCLVFKLNEWEFRNIVMYLFKLVNSLRRGGKIWRLDKHVHQGENGRHRSVVNHQDRNTPYPTSGTLLVVHCCSIFFGADIIFLWRMYLDS